MQAQDDEPEPAAKPEPDPPSKPSTRGWTMFMQAQDDEGVVDTEGWAKPDAKGELPPGKAR